MSVLPKVWMLVLALAALCAATLQSAEIMTLGSLPGGSASRAGLNGVSADGAVVVGYSGSEIGTRAFRWTEAGGMVGLGTLPGDTRSYAYGVSADGTIVVGASITDIAGQAFRWTEAGGMVGLGFLPGSTTSSAVDVSADGTVVVGHSDYGIWHGQAIRWTETGGMAGLGFLPGATFSSADGVSADGSVVIGRSGIESQHQAFRWTEAGGMMGLGYLPGGTTSVAYGVSDDGTVVVGSSYTGSGKSAFRWTEADGMVDLGYPPSMCENPPCDIFCVAYGASGDGEVVVGECSDYYSKWEAFRWTEVGGMESIPDLLSGSGIDISNWRIDKAFDANKDGSIIVGYLGIEDIGSEQAYITDIGDILPLPTNPIDIIGTVKAANGVDICALVLANGQFTFSCDPPGEFSLANVPRDVNRKLKRQIYADGFIPKIDILTDSTEEAVVMTRSGICPNYNIPYEPAFVPDSAGKTIYIAGQILLQNGQTPICAMVLANGKFMFSCDGTGGYFLKIPLDNNGQFKLQVYADGFAPTIQTFDEFKTTNNVHMARALECQ